MPVIVFVAGCVLISCDHPIIGVLCILCAFGVFS